MKQKIHVYPRFTSSVDCYIISANKHDYKGKAGKPPVRVSAIGNWSQMECTRSSEEFVSMKNTNNIISKTRGLENK